MNGLHTLLEIEAALAKYIPLASEIIGKDITLDRMNPMMTALGNPEKQLKVIHIAGTSGKTSTTYYIAALLTAAGKKVGMTVSPHVDSIAERLQVNMQPITVAVFGEALEEFLEIIRLSDIEPTYFELLIALAYWYFAKVGVDYAVIETGLGGLHDGTNIAKEYDKLCVITDIGYDHMHVLGNTISEIAAQKAGIIHGKNDVYMYEQSPEVMSAIKQRCDIQKAYLHTIGQSYVNEPDMFKDLPSFQKRNWHLAHAVFDAVKIRDGIVGLSDKKLAQAISTQIPARMDQKKIKGKLVIMDGAHNGQKMQAFVGSFMTRWPGKRAAVLLSLKTSKDYTEVLPLLRSIASTLIITTFSGTQDRFVESIPPQQLAESAEHYGFSRVVAMPDQDDAYELLMNQPDDVVIITGSFYLIGQLRHKHKELI